MRIVYIQVASNQEGEESNRNHGWEVVVAIGGGGEGGTDTKTRHEALD